MFREKFKAWRIKHKLSQGEVAQKLGITQQAVANWELGLRVPNRRLWKRIVDLTNGEITIEDLLTEEPAEVK